MDNPLISIIVPVYNVELYLDGCIQSIVGQTYRTLEIILVDDGSKDQSPAICDNWARKDARIKVIHKTNGGASAARNCALDVARGDYIGFVDSDDYIAEDMYESLMQAMAECGIGIACCSPYIVSDEGVVIRQGMIAPNSKMNVEQALRTVFRMQADTSFCCKLYRRDIFDDIRFPVGETNEEFSLIIPTIVKAGGMICVPRCLYYYRQHINSVTKKVIPNENYTHCLHMNLQRMEAQFNEFGVQRTKDFGFFSAHFAYWAGLSYEKKFGLISDKVKKDYKIYRKIMIKNAVIYLFSKYSSMKDKILYILVITKLLRPLYLLCCPERL